MRRTPRTFFLFIVILTVLSLFITLPKIEKVDFVIPVVNQKVSFDANFDPNNLLRKIGLGPIAFRKGLDLEGGTSITFRAEMDEIPQSQRESALDSASIVIERRVNLFGVSEPIVQTSRVNNEYRIIVDLPGVTNIEQAKQLVGQTAQLTFWEDVATGSAKIASVSAMPAGITQIFTNPSKSDLTGSDLDSTSVSFDPNTGQPQVQLNFTSEGSKKFADITKRNVNKIVAIVLDDQVIEAPRVNEAILTGDAVISGSFTTEGAKALSTQLNAGALPVQLTPLKELVIGPTLGAESLQKSLFAGILGFLIIVGFMIALYGRLGIIASLALIVYAIISLAVFKLSSLTPYGITLTLSGIAGFILSIGMAVDANILIFERMKEERRAGKPMNIALEIGFSRAWTSIRDSNVSTIITSIVLWYFGTGIVKGFAVVLLIGVLISMFSAITVTRTFLRMVYK